MDLTKPKLPRFAHSSLTSDSYYKFHNERILFVNVERDFDRIAPLFEVALSLNDENDVFFFDLARPNTSFKERFGNYWKELFRGRWIPSALKPIVEGFGVEYIPWPQIPSLQEFLCSQVKFSIEDRELLLLAKRNQEIEIYKFPEQAHDWFEQSQYGLSLLLNILIKTIVKHEVNRVFCWNGRFVLSTLVDIACRKAGVISSSIEMGSENESFEIFRTNPWDFSDTHRRVLDLKNRQSNGLINEVNTSQITSHFKPSNSNIFSSNFKPRPTVLESKDVVFFTSSLHELGTRPGYLYSIDVQFDLVKKISEITRNHGLNFCIRVHPNPQTPNYEEWESQKWREFNKEELSNSAEIILPNSSTSSYDLAKQAKLNITYQSTIGFEILSLSLPILMLNPEIAPPLSKDQLLVWAEDRLVGMLDEKTLICDSKEMELLANYHYFYRGFRFHYLQKINDKVFFSGILVAREANSSSQLLKYSYRISRKLKLLKLFGNKLYA